MFKIVKYSADIQPAWDELAGRCGTVFHTTAFRRVLLDSFGYNCCYHAVIDEKDRLRALLPLIKGRNLAMEMAAIGLPFVNYIDVCATDEMAKKFLIDSIPMLRKNNSLGYVELRLKELVPQVANWQRTDGHVTFVLPLEQDEEHVLSLSTRSNRNHVRKVYRNNCFASSLDQCYLKDFYNIYVRRMKQLGSPSPGIKFFESLFKNFPNDAYLLSVIDCFTNNVIGGMVLLSGLSDRTLFYLYGANLIEYNKQYLNNFMYWEAVKLGFELNMIALDLGRSQIGSGTYKFKSQWGAIPQPLYYRSCQETMGKAWQADKEQLKIFIDLWKVIPAAITDVVGRKIIKYLMP